MTYTLFIRPVSHLSKDTISRTFSEYGEVCDIHIPRTFQTKKRQSFGYVKYTDKHAAARAIDALHDKPLLGKVMSVVWADQAPKTPEEMVERKRARREVTQRPRDEDDEDERPRARLRERDVERRSLPLHEQFFTAVDYPEGVGVEYTPIYQKNLPPVGQRRQFFSWVFITEEQKAKILREELERQTAVARRGA
jgi:RNA recognition motif-containing protein